MGLLYAPATYQLSQDDPYSIPPGLIGGVVSQMPQEGGFCGPSDSAAVYIGRGEAVIDFRLPEAVAGEVGEIALEIGSDGGWGGAPMTALYDWGMSEWVSVNEPVLGRNLIPGESGLVSPDGLVRVQLASTGSRSGCFYLELGVQGTQQ
jgi:hypothetical protein